LTSRSGPNIVGVFKEHELGDSLDRGAMEGTDESCLRGPGCGRGEKTTVMASRKQAPDRMIRFAQNSHRNPSIPNHTHTFIYEGTMFSEARNFVITGGNFIQGTTTGTRCIEER
jgi:hypothetical protein